MGRRVSPRGRRRSGGDPHQGPRRRQGPGELLERAEGRHGEAGGRVLDGNDDAAGSRPALLHGDRRWRGVRRSRQPRVLRREQVRERRRGAGAGRRLLRDQGRAARAGPRGLVLVEADRDVAARAGLPALRLRHAAEDALSGALPAAWRRRGRDRLGPPGPRQLHPRQPDRRGQGQADDRGDGLRLRAARRPAGRRIRAPRRRARRLRAPRKRACGRCGTWRRRSRPT